MMPVNEPLSCVRAILLSPPQLAQPVSLYQENARNEGSGKWQTIVANLESRGLL